MYAKDLKLLSYYEFDWGCGDYEYWYVLANTPTPGFPNSLDIESFVLNVDSYTLIHGLNWLAAPIKTSLDTGDTIIDQFNHSGYPALTSLREVDPWNFSFSIPIPAVKIPTLPPTLFGAYVGQNNAQTNNTPTPTPGSAIFKDLDLDFSNGEKKVLPANVNSSVCVQCGKNNKQIQGFRSTMYWCPNCEP